MLIKVEYVDNWLNPSGADLASLYTILDDHERPHYAHKLAA